MNNIFYHLLCVNDGVNRFKKTYNKIKQSGLIDNIDKIYVNCVGKNKQTDSNKIIDLEKAEVSVVPDVKFKVSPRKKAYGRTLDENESSTMNLMREFAISNTHGNALYLHSKGASKSNYDDVCIECINAWNDYMEYFLIERYEECVKYLKDYDTCGCNLVRTPKKCPYPTDAKHYCGNFYWATNEFLAKTEECWNHRYYPEHYFLRSAGVGNHKEIFKADFDYKDFYTRILKRETYEY